MYLSLGVAPLFTTGEQDEITSLSRSLADAHMVLAIKNPADAYTLSAFVDPLKALSWLAVITFCLVLPVFLIGTTRSYTQYSFAPSKLCLKLGILPGMDHMMTTMTNSLGANHLH